MKIREIITEAEAQKTNKTFILYFNDKAVATYDNPDEAMHQGKMIAARVPNTRVEVKQETCTLTPVQLKENLKKCLEEQWSTESAEVLPELDEARKRKKSKSKSKRKSSANRSPVPRFYGAWGFGEWEDGGGGE